MAVFLWKIAQFETLPSLSYKINQADTLLQLNSRHVFDTQGGTDPGPTIKWMKAKATPLYCAERFLYQFRGRPVLMLTDDGENHRLRE